MPLKVSPVIFDNGSTALYCSLWLEVGCENAGGDRSKNNVMPLGRAQQG
jgi:hypothetical protein